MTEYQKISQINLGLCLEFFIKKRKGIFDSVFIENKLFLSIGTKNFASL